MQKLHLVGFTTDHEGLILSARRGTRSGGYLLAIDEALEAAVDDLRALRADEHSDDPSEQVAARPSRVESTLPVREIQARLRQGRSIAEVAKAAGVDPEWVDRFAPPILAERAQVITKVRAVPLRRSRLGLSVQPIGDAVRHHLADRGVALTPDEFSAAWTARQVAEGRWAVSFGFHHRARNHVLQFDFDESSGEVVAADRVSGQLGYVAPPSTSTSSDPSRRQDKPAVPARPTVNRAVVSTGFRPDGSPAKAVSRPAKERQRAAAAMHKGAAQRAIEVERAAARRARERSAQAARKAREDKATLARIAREQTQRERASAVAERVRLATAKKAAAAAVKAEKAKVVAAKAKKAAAKKVAAEKAKVVAAKAKKAAAKKVAAERAKVVAAKAKKAAAKKAAAKKVPAKKVPANKAKVEAAEAKPAAKKLAAKKPAAKKVPTRKVPTRKVPAKKAPATRVPATRVPATRVPAVVSRPQIASRGAPARTGGTTQAATAGRQALPVAPQPATPQPATPRPPPSRLATPTVGTSDQMVASRSVRAAGPVVVTPLLHREVAPPVVSRPLFRQGFVEHASGDGPAEPSANGLESGASRADRPRRTRPLRAT